MAGSNRTTEIKVRISEENDLSTRFTMELDNNKTLSLQSLQSVFANATGLKWKDVSGEWRIVIVENQRFLFGYNDFDPNTMFFVIRAISPTTARTIEPLSRDPTPPLAPRRSLWDYVRGLLSEWYRDPSVSYKKLQ